MHVSFALIPNMSATNFQIKLNILRSILPFEVELKHYDMVSRIMHLWEISNDYRERMKDGFCFFCKENKGLANAKNIWDSFSFRQKEIYWTRAVEIYRFNENRIMVSGKQLYHTMMCSDIKSMSDAEIQNNMWVNLSDESQQKWNDIAIEINNLWQSWDATHMYYLLVQEYEHLYKRLTA